MTPNSLGSTAIAYVGPRRSPQEATGPLTRHGRDAAMARSDERAPVTPDRP